MAGEKLKQKPTALNWHTASEKNRWMRDTEENNTGGGLEGIEGYTSTQDTHN